MYRPPHFDESDPRLLYEVIENHGFATLISVAGGAPVVSHIPVFPEQMTAGKVRLTGHFARANDHWRLLDGKTTMTAVFQGPHDYISPRWYDSKGLVPTWNYIAVHVSGVPEMITDRERTLEILDQLTNAYEQGAKTPWTTTALTDEKIDHLLKGIVAFEMPVDRIEGKFKLSQNRSDKDRLGVMQGLKNKGNDNALSLSRWMEK